MHRLAFVLLALCALSSCRSQGGAVLEPALGGHAGAGVKVDNGVDVGVRAGVEAGRYVLPGNEIAAPPGASWAPAPVSPRTDPVPAAAPGTASLPPSSAPAKATGPVPCVGDGCCAPPDLGAEAEPLSPKD